jgi:hypothetical protein
MKLYLFQIVPHPHLHVKREGRLFGILRLVLFQERRERNDHESSSLGKISRIRGRKSLIGVFCYLEVEIQSRSCVSTRETPGVYSAKDLSRIVSITLSFYFRKLLPHPTAISRRDGTPCQNSHLSQVLKTNQRDKI